MNAPHPISIDRDDLTSRKEFYRLKTDPHRDFRNPPDSIVDFASGEFLQFQSYQLAGQVIMSPDTPYMRLHLSHACHPAKTKIIMWNGDTKDVAKVKIGDVLMGDDNTPRHVVQLYTGFDDIYCVDMGDDNCWYCNRNHILTICSDVGSTLVDIPLPQFLQLPRAKQALARMCAPAISWPLHQRCRFCKDTDAAYDLGRLPNYDAILMRIRCSLRCRRNIIASLIDHYGKYDRANGARIPYDRTYMYIARSIGIVAVRRGSWIYLTGNLGYIPSRIYGMCDTENTSRYARYKFKIRLVAHNERYYGFELRDDLELRPNGEILRDKHRYLLANFIITHNTGSGKTLAACGIARPFVRAYQSLYSREKAKKNYSTAASAVALARETPSVWVLGFEGTKSAFMRELLSHTEFGYVTGSELEELRHRKIAANSQLDDDIKQYKEYYSRLKRRVTDKRKGGFFKFLGYDELVNKLWKTGPSTESFGDMEKRAAASGLPLEDLIDEEIRAGRLVPDKEFVALWENGLMICDEMQNLYNSDTKNNRGAAVQYLLGTVPSLRFLSLSATPITNSPTEVVELLNFLITPPEQPTAKSKLFNRDDAGRAKLLPGALETIGRLSRGKISFLQNTNIRQYPRRILCGENVTDENNFALPYLKFDVCVMTDRHRCAWEKYCAAENTKLVPAGGFAVYDMVFPDPDDANCGIFLTKAAKYAVQAASQEWRDSNRIELIRAGTSSQIFGGEWLAMPNLALYSAKYSRMVALLYEIISDATNNPKYAKKTFISHPRVSGSGVLLIGEILRQNGFVDYRSDPFPTTLCWICGVVLSKHNSAPDHQYIPAKYMIIHGELSKQQVARLIAAYNAPTNINGIECGVIIGSQVIRESYDFKAIQRLIICNLDTNIPIMLQIFGRCGRTNSHVELTPDQREYRVHILLSVSGRNTDSVFGPEVARYADKLQDYETIQQIERELYKNAIDAIINRELIMQPDNLAEYFPSAEMADKVHRGEVLEPEASPALGNLYFDVPHYRRWQPHELNLSTFQSNEYWRDEIAQISSLIKRAFLREPVRTYGQLWDWVQKPPIGMSINPALFSEHNFVIALNLLVEGTAQSIEANDVKTIAASMWDPACKYIRHEGIDYKIAQIGEFYVMFPETIVGSPQKFMHDVETYLRPQIYAVSTWEVSFKEYLGAVRTDDAFVNARAAYAAKLAAGDPIECLLYDFNVAFQQSLFAETVKVVSQSRPSGKSAAKIDPVADAVLQLGRKFCIWVTLAEVRPYKNVVKQFAGGLPNDIPPTTPLGYMVKDIVKLFDQSATDKNDTGEWLDINKFSLNRHHDFRENDIIIGMLEPVQQFVEFKIRPPAQTMQSRAVSESRHRELRQDDRRLLEPGIVCRNKQKPALLELAARLKISTQSNNNGPAKNQRKRPKDEKHQIKTKPLCALIRDTLLDREATARGSSSRIKWLYGWWDQTAKL